MKSRFDLVRQINAKLVAACEAGLDRTTVQAEITQLQKKLKLVANWSLFSGGNR
jgi:flagellin